MQVVKSGGVTGVLSREGSLVDADFSVDSSAVKDSLDCLAGIAASSQEGGQVCLESEASTAACFALQVCPRVNLAVAIALIQSMLLMLRRLTCPDIEAV